MPINPEDARPLAVQIADDLRVRIAKGDFAPGARFPSLRSLATEYGVAEMTVHNAVRDLQREKLIVSMSGRGTYVRASVSTTDSEEDPFLAELSAIKAELQELRERVAAQEAGDANEQLKELMRRVDALERADERPEQ